MRSFSRLVVLATLGWVIAGPVAAQSRCPQFYPRVLPKFSSSLHQQLREVCFDAFVSLHSGRTKTPVLTVERLTREQVTQAQDEERTNRFYPEARLPRADRAQLDDYRDSGYDRGHMAPAADMPTAQAMAQSFSMANMVPQARHNNRHTWASVEKATRRFVMRASGPVYVFTGPVFTKPVQTIGASQVWVPAHLFKLVYDQAGGRAWAYWVDNTDAARLSRPITYQALVERTGMELLPGVEVRD
ncbi:endonuclease G [Sphaerotilus hippei]|uniref:Endonuclease n=1 Tax=Sphaerotilus hippei TaxID=744406 RepID=A0A318H3H7_9BURK|nr:DNA/RNA non-specific endonuclease [Sphaerotilus hippei]PXW98097.1 endonuclease G [Sphaerotilus hippei]